MSARKLGRFAGLVFALAVVFGGVTVGAETTASTETASVLTTTTVLDWN